MKFKKLLTVSLSTAVLITSLVGCSSTENSSKESTSPRKEKNEIVLSVCSEPTGLDPTVGGTYAVGKVFFSTLLARDEKLNIVNELATGYEVSEDKLVWTVKLREDAKFTDGESITAEDVVYTFKTAGESGSTIDLTTMDGIEAKDEYTVEFKLKQPQSTFVNKLIDIPIVPSHAHDENYAVSPKVTSGPYKFEQWDKGQQIIASVNEDYFGEKAKIDKVTLLFLDNDAALAALKSGEVDMAQIPPSFADQTVDGKVLKEVESIENLGITFPMVKSGKKTDKGYAIGNDVTSDIAIRQAINYGVSRADIIEGVLSGYGTPAYVGIEGMPWYNSEVEIKDNDIDKAKQILEDAGWIDTDNDGIREKDGLKAEFKLSYIAEAMNRQEMALLVSEQVKEIGINAIPTAVTWDNAVETLHCDPIVLGWGDYNAQLLYNLYHSENAGVEWYNTGFYKNETVDKYLDQAMSSKTEEEAIPHWKNAQWDGETGLSAKGDATWAWLANNKHLFLVEDGLDIGTPKVQPHGGRILENINTWCWK